MGTSKFVHFLPILLPFLLVAAEVEEFVAEAGDEVQLSCPVKTSECGNYHSLKWYRDSTRVFVYSPIAGFKNAEDILMDRCLDMSQASLGSDCPRGNLVEGDEEIGLTVGPIRMEDGGEYRCEITYLDVSSDCPLVHFSNLRTIAPPDFQRISLTPGGEDMSEQVVGPYAAGTEASFTCESGGGKPAPTITWVFGDEEAEGDVEEEVEEEEGKTTSTLTIMLVREHSGSDLTCKVSHEALEEDLVTKMQVDVNIAVESVELESLEGQEDEEMEVVCRATKSRPEAVITWALPDHLEFTEETEVELLEDDTFDTVSTIRFTPTAEDDSISVNCQAVNEVMEDPLETSEQITVFFAPRVSVDEEGQSVFEGEDATIQCQVEANPENLTRLEWLKDDSLVEDDRFVVEESTLTITGVQAEDAGEYRCVAENSVGESESEGSHTLEVFYPPSMELHMSPEDPVVEENEVDVELHCNLIDGHPSVLHSVFWYRDGQLFRVTPDPEVCQDGWTGATLDPTDSDWVQLDLENDTMEEEDPCSNDPSLLVLPTVSRENFGHYSCAGRNTAGEGEQSEGLFLDVQYLPDVGEVLLEEEPVKGEDVQLSCFLEEPGNPPATDFLWKKDGEELEETSSNLTLTSLAVADQANYSCAGRNPIGVGESDLIFLDITAPPHMLDGLSEETVVVSGNQVALTCHLECSPGCAVEWLVDGNPLEGEFIMEEEAVEHNVSEEEMEEDEESNQFSSILSTLTWQQLKNIEDDFNMTCRAKVDEEGDDEKDLVFSTTTVSVHYLPGASELVIEDGSDLVKGNNALLECLLEDLGKPEVTEYHWTKDGEELEEVSSMLNLTSLGVASQGNYTCAGVNHLGAGQPQSLFLDITAPPHLIEGPSDFTGVVVGEETSLKCHVECSPLCGIEWLVDGELVDETVVEDEGGSGDGQLSIGGYTVEMEDLEEDEEKNQFSSVISTLSWKQLLHIDGNFTIACRVQGYDMDSVDVDSSGLEDGFIVDLEELDSFDPVIAFTTVMIEYAPEPPMMTSEMDCSASNKLGCETLELEEGVEGATLDCSSSALPPATITWIKGGQEVATGGQFVFPDPLHRDSAGDYTCRASNVHGREETTMTLSVLYPPSCTVTHSVEGADLLLKCSAYANPEAELSWSLRDTPLDGKAVDGTGNQQTSILRLELSDNSTGLYYCHASNSLGEGSCHLELTESMLTAGLSELELRIIIIVCVVVGVLLIIVFLCYLYHRKNNKGNKAAPAAGKGKGSAGKDLENGNGKQQPSADKSFYENLPFHGLKSPPKQVLNPKSDDHLDYADADYKDLYAEGPVGYKAASKQAKEGKRL